MAIRYAGSRLQTTAFVKRLCLQAISAAYQDKGDMDIPMEALRQYSSQHTQLQQLCESAEWGVEEILELPTLTKFDEL
eukprot:10281883-Karenia_brevis.AAC.1